MASYGPAISQPVNFGYFKTIMLLHYSCRTWVSGAHEFLVNWVHSPLFSDKLI